jgi:hypothetical protein
MSRERFLCHAWNPANESLPVFECFPQSREDAHTEARKLVLSQPTYAVQVYDRSELIAEYQGAEVPSDWTRDLALTLSDVPIYRPVADAVADVERLLTYADSGLFTADLVAFSGPAVC